MADTRDLTVKFKGDTSSLEQSMKQVQGANDATHQSFLKLTGAVAAGQAVYALASSAMHKISSEATAVVSGTEEWTKSTMKLQREMGVTAEASSGLLAVFQRFGIEVDGASKDMGLFSKQIMKAADPAKYAGSVFDDLGIKLQDNNGILRTADQVMLDVADKFKAMPNGVQKTAEAMQLFGKSGKDLLPILNLGSAGIKDLETQAAKMGLVITQNNIDSVRKLILAQKDWKEANEGIRLQIGLAIIPKMTEFANLLVEKGIPTMKKIGTEIYDVALKIEQYLAPKFKNLLGAIQEAMPTFEKLYNNVLEPLSKIFGEGLVLAIGLSIDIWTLLLKTVTPVFEYLDQHRQVVELLAITFGTLGASMALGAAFDALTLGFATFQVVTIPSMIASLGALSAAFVAAIPVLAVGLALGAIILKFQETMNVLDETNAHINASLGSIQKANQQYINLANNGKVALDQLYRFQQSTGGTSTVSKQNIGGTQTYIPKFATGVENFGGGLAYVHEGEMLMNLSKGTTVVPKKDVQSKMGSTTHNNISVNVNVGMYAGMPVEKRRIAEELWRELVRSARAQGVSLPSIGSVNLQ